MGELELWARVNGTLPSTPAGLTLAPFVADRAMYDIRYVSLSSVSWSVPYPAYRTLYDWEIRAHYTRQGRAWDGRYTVWFGPPGLETRTPAFVEEEGGALYHHMVGITSFPCPGPDYTRPGLSAQATMADERGPLSSPLLIRSPLPALGHVVPEPPADPVPCSAVQTDPLTTPSRWGGKLGGAEGRGPACL